MKIRDTEKRRVNSPFSLRTAQCKHSPEQNFASKTPGIAGKLPCQFYLYLMPYSGAEGRLSLFQSGIAHLEKIINVIASLAGAERF